MAGSRASGLPTARATGGCSAAATASRPFEHLLRLRPREPAGSARPQHRRLRHHRHHPRRSSRVSPAVRGGRPPAVRATGRPPALRSPSAYNHRMYVVARRQAGTARLIGLHEDDGEFDRAFWAAMTPQPGWTPCGTWRLSTWLSRDTVIHPDFSDLLSTSRVWRVPRTRPRATVTDRRTKSAGYIWPNDEGRKSACHHAGARPRSPAVHGDDELHDPQRAEASSSR